MYSFSASEARRRRRRHKVSCPLRESEPAELSVSAGAGPGSEMECQVHQQAPRSFPVAFRLWAAIPALRALQEAGSQVPDYCASEPKS